MAMGFAVYAFLCLTFRTASFFNRQPFFHYYYVFFLFAAYKFECGEDSGWSGADNYQITVNFVQNIRAPFLNICYEADDLNKKAGLSR